MIKGLPEDGDVRNTVVFKEVAPYLTDISVNQFIYELLRVVKHVEAGNVDAISRQGFDAPDVDMAFTWRETPQGQVFWALLHANFRRNKGGW